MTSNAPAPCARSVAPAQVDFTGAPSTIAPAAARLGGESVPGVARKHLGTEANSVDARTRPTTALTGDALP